MPSPRFAFSTGCFYQADLHECLAPIRDAGFDSVELSSYPAHLDCESPEAIRRARSRLQELSLEVHSMHAPFGHIDITSHDLDARRHGVEAVLSSARAAADLGARYLVLHPGPERGGFGPAERAARYDRAVASIDRICDETLRLGLELVLENMLPHLFAGRARDLLWLAGALRDLDVGFCLDTGHAFLAGELDTMPHRLGRRVRMSHVHDNHGLHDDHRAPGDGKIDWGRYVASLAEIGFEGVCVLELGHYPSAAEATRAAASARADLTRRMKDIASRGSDSQS